MKNYYCYYNLEGERILHYIKIILVYIILIYYNVLFHTYIIYCIIIFISYIVTTEIVAMFRSLAWLGTDGSPGGKKGSRSRRVPDPKARKALWSKGPT